MTELLAKRCRHCDSLKVAAEFPRNSKLHDGFDSWCRACHTAAVRDWMLRNPDRLRRIQEKNAAKNREKTAQARVLAAIGKSCPVPWATCKECGEGFPHRPAARTTGYCSAHCRQISNRRILAGSRARKPQKHYPPPPRLPVAEKHCAECSASFQGTAGRRFCSKKCGAYFHRHANNRMRRVVKARAGGRVELVFRLSVFDRDGWRCQLCRRRVRRVSGNLPMGPTLDHIVPVARGGDHTYENVQLAHRACNMKKRTGVGQLRLTL